MEEIWCDISDYKGLYQVSTLGRARSLDRIVYDRGRHFGLKYLKEHEND